MAFGYLATGYRLFGYPNDIIGFSLAHSRFYRGPNVGSSRIQFVPLVYNKPLVPSFLRLLTDQHFLKLLKRYKRSETFTSEMFAT
jgi:hypothetical protein